MREAERERGRAAEEECRRECAERTPVAEDHGRERDEPAPGGHVLAERAEVADRQIRAAEGREDAGQNHRRVARGVYRDADRVCRARVLANRTKA